MLARFFTLSILGLGLGFSTSSSGFAQRQISVDDLSGLGKNDREAIHPGDPLVIVGIDQEDNAFRTASPTFTLGELAVTQVDQDELRARRLAMYEKDANYSTPPLSSRRMSAIVENRPLPKFQADRPAGQQADPSDEEEKDSNLPYWLGGAVLAGAFMILRHR